MDNPHFSDSIKARRKELGLPQGEVASRAGIEQSQVSKLERGLDVRLSTLMKVLTALDLEVSLVPRPRPGTITGGPAMPTPFERPSGSSYPIPGSTDRFTPKTESLLERLGTSGDNRFISKAGSLLERFGISDDDDDPARGDGGG